MDSRNARTPQAVFSLALLVTLVAQLTFQDHAGAMRWDHHKLESVAVAGTSVHTFLGATDI